MPGEQWGQKALQSMATRLNRIPYKKGSYFPANTKYLLGFNEPNIECDPPAMKPAVVLYGAGSPTVCLYAIV